MTMDVAAGRESVSHTQAYVSACHAIGYQHPDLTAHGAQVVEWYSGEDGLDLRALDADCAVLRGAAAAADEAVRVARDGQAVVVAAWDGESGSVAADFIDRHCAGAEAVARALHVAADACQALRERLGQLVDEKVQAAISIDDRHAAERAAWLAAAAAVTSGGVGREEAVEVVHQQITPYVDADIRTDWIAAMRSTTESVAAAYEDALRQLNSLPAPYFEVPGQFGAPLVEPASVTPSAPVQTVPAAAMPADPLPLPSVTAPDAAVAQPLPPATPAAPLAEPPTGLGTATPAGMPAMPSMPDVGGGASGLAGQIADALGGLFDGVPDTPPDYAVPEVDDPVEKDDEDKPDDDVVEPDAEDDVPEEVPVAVEPVVEEPQPVDEPIPTEPVPPPPPPDPQPEPLAAEQPDERTPCEIAADELAQVGQ